MNFKNEFDLQSGFIHLNNAGVTPLTKACAAAMHLALDDAMRFGFHGYEKLMPKISEARGIVANFINVKPSQVAFVHNCSTAISLMAFGLPLYSGDKVLITDQEYPSNRYPWFSRAQKDNLEIVEFKSEESGKINWEKFIDCIDNKTKVVVLSWVQYATGVRAPLKKISERARKFGAWVVVDVIQGLGVIPFDFVESGVDAICCGSHKWLCGPLGHGFLALTEELCTQVYPIIQGAFTFADSELPFDKNRLPHASALRFESGAPNFLSTIGLAESIKVFQKIGLDNIYKKSMELRRTILNRVTQSGYTIKGEVSDESGSPIVSFIPKTNVTSYVEKLKASRISFALRSGGIRLSPHAFNSIEELNLALDLLV